jgi:hypothetical protein
MSGDIPPLPNTPSCRGAQFKKAQGRLYLYLSRSNIKQRQCHSHLRISRGCYAGIISGMKLKSESLKVAFTAFVLI